jgi:arginase
VAACFDLNRQLARQVRSARADGALPVVLTGNCHSQQAVVAGLGIEARGLVWLDCHADFNTPETTESGYFDGYGLAMVVGDCWQTLCATVPGFAPLADDRVILAGVRDVEDGERRRLANSSVRRIDPGNIARLADELGSHAPGQISLHVDLDVLDPSCGRANAYAIGPGITADELVEAVATVTDQRELAALTLSAYDPTFDADGRVADVAMRVFEVATGRS